MIYTPAGIQKSNNTAWKWDCENTTISFRTDDRILDRILASSSEIKPGTLKPFRRTKKKPPNYCKIYCTTALHLSRSDVPCDQRAYAQQRTPRRLLSQMGICDTRSGEANSTRVILISLQRRPYLYYPLPGPPPPP